MNFLQIISIFQDEEEDEEDDMDNSDDDGSDAGGKNILFLFVSNYVIIILSGHTISIPTMQQFLFI